MKISVWTVMVAITGSSYAQPVPPIAESPGAVGKLGYATVDGALKSLKAKPDVQVYVTQPDGWTIVNEGSPIYAVWSFTPKTHPAYPAVVRRTVEQDKAGKVSIQMVALCEATKEPCDQLIRDFQALTEQMRDSVRSRSR